MSQIALEAIHHRKIDLAQSVDLRCAFERSIDFLEAVSQLESPQGVFSSNERPIMYWLMSTGNKKLLHALTDGIPHGLLPYLNHLPEKLRGFSGLEVDPREGSIQNDSLRLAAAVSLDSSALNGFTDLPLTEQASTQTLLKITSDLRTSIGEVSIASDVMGMTTIAPLRKPKDKEDLRTMIDEIRETRHITTVTAIGGVKPNFEEMLELAKYQINPYTLLNVANSDTIFFNLTNRMRIFNHSFISKYSKYHIFLRDQPQSIWREYEDYLITTRKQSGIVIDLNDHFVQDNLLASIWSQSEDGSMIQVNLASVLPEILGWSTVLVQEVMRELGQEPNNDFDLRTLIPEIIMRMKAFHV